MNKMKNQKILWIVIIANLALWLVSFVFYQTIIFPHREEKRLKNISECVASANDNYLKSWNVECQRLGLEDNCIHEKETATLLFDLQKASIDVCLRSYP